MNKKYYSELLGATVYPEKQTILFYKGLFSQWYKCNFSCIIGGEVYQVNCAEQAIMLQKANHFGDEYVFKQILNAKHPSEQKALGRCVKNFDVVEWESVAVTLDISVNIQKFTQNAHRKELLLLTDPYLLVEASPTDKIWGIGYTETDPKVFDEQEKWGRNLLGEVLVRTRDCIKETL